jgi:hypothetical protein
MATFALVHGSWHGAWCWERLEPELAARGHRAIAIDLPIEDPDAGLGRHAELVAEALVGVDDDVILVGHSMAGSTIPLVARHRPLRHLVFLAALVPEPGRSVTDRYTAEDVYVPGFVGNTLLREDGASYWPDPEAAVRCFYHDCTAADAAWAVSRLRPQSAAPRLEPWPLDACRTSTAPRSSAATSASSHRRGRGRCRATSSGSSRSSSTAVTPPSSHGPLSWRTSSSAWADRPRSHGPGPGYRTES